MYRVDYKPVLFIILLAGLAQASSFDYIVVSGAKPDILLIMVIFASLLLRGRDAVKCALVAGMLKDMASSSIAGGYMLSFALIAVILNTHMNKFYKERPLVQICLSFISYVFMDACIVVLNTIAYRQADILCFPVIPILKAAAYTCIVSPMVFIIVSRALRINLSQVY
ncbi:MAG: rod shape-determining protein MreD [Candidatus Omnitrophota bacterium]|jgi:rod shape-determining protein MreD